ncbi:arylsulfatase [Bremerella sp. T1]|uniref:arylsulfatase n=1 Tax=Bremerella sp. TYQ1 TaxID=3119568 RepID=UPI001CCF0F81|nr:arylsulfatase [Bremerella volcania]UBM34968.1 arylsulfatase [Bremerella volcania]
MVRLIAARWLATALCVFAYSTVALADRPNVVLVMTDDQGYGDLGLHGNEVIRTPNIDQFAQQGTQLTQFYCSPVCAPTRASLMTGRYFYRTGVIHTSRGAARMATDEKTLAEVFQDAGYVTGIFGKWHLGDNYPMRPQDQGFLHSLVHKSGGITQAPDQPNDYFDPLLWKDGHPVQAKGYCTDVFFTEAIDFIRLNDQQPFFAYIATNAPHTPLIVDEAAWKRYADKGMDEATAKVYAMVENIDDNFGRLLKTLDELKLRENTIVIFLTDNGPQQKRFNGGLNGRKSMVLEGGIHVPCFVQWPGKLKQPREINTRHAHLDWLPTLIEATGIDADLPHKLDGVSFWPQLSGEQQEVTPRNLFFQVHRGLDPEPYHNAAVLGPRYKLVMNVGSFGRETLAEVPEKQRTGIQLFDLEKDPDEQNNLAAMMPQKVEELTEAYDAWFADVKSSRNFETPPIVLGSVATDSTLLCRYQDGHYEEGRSVGWKVSVDEPLLVQLRLNQEAQPGQKLMVQWLGNVISYEVENLKQPVAALQLPPGTGLLGVWLQEEGKPRQYVSDNSTKGDVVVHPVREME